MAAYSFHGLKGVTREGRFFVANDTYAEGSSFGAASWTLAMHTGEKTFWRATVEVWTLMILGHFPVSPDQQVWARSYAPCGGVTQVVDYNVAFDG